MKYALADIWNMISMSVQLSKLPAIFKNHYKIYIHDVDTEWNNDELNEWILESHF